MAKDCGPCDDAKRERDNIRQDASNAYFKQMTQKAQDIIGDFHPFEVDTKGGGLPTAEARGKQILADTFAPIERVKAAEAALSPSDPNKFKAADVRSWMYASQDDGMPYNNFMTMLNNTDVNAYVKSLSLDEFGTLRQYIRNSIGGTGTGDAARAFENVHKDNIVRIVENAIQRSDIVQKLAGTPEGEDLAKIQQALSLEKTEGYLQRNDPKTIDGWEQFVELGGSPKAAETRIGEIDAQLKSGTLRTSEINNLQREKLEINDGFKDAFAREEQAKRQAEQELLKTEKAVDQYTQYLRDNARATSMDKSSKALDIINGMELPTDVKNSGHLITIRNALAKAAEGESVVGDIQLTEMIRTLESLSTSGITKEAEKKAIEDLASAMNADAQDLTYLKDRALAIKAQTQNADTLDKAYTQVQRISEIIKQDNDAKILAEKASTALDAINNEGLDVNQNVINQLTNAASNPLMGNAKGAVEIGEKAVAEERAATTFATNYDTSTLTKENIGKTYTDISNTVSESAAKKVMAKSLAEDIADFDTRNKIPSDIQQLVDRIRTAAITGKTTPADTRTMIQVMERMDNGKLKEILGLTTKIDALNAAQRAGVLGSLTAKKLLGVGAILGTGWFVLVDVPNQYMNRAMQEQKAWEAIAQLAGIKVEKLTVSNIDTTFFGDTAKKDQTLFMSARDDMLSFYNFCVGLPIIGGYYKAVMTTPVANMVGQDINAQNVMGTLRDRGLAIEDSTQPLGWRKTSEDERNTIFYKDPTKLMRNVSGDPNYTTEKAKEIWGDGPHTTKDGTTLAAWQFALYYRASKIAGGLGVGIDSLGNAVAAADKRWTAVGGLEAKNDALAEGEKIDDAAKAKFGTTQTTTTPTTTPTSWTTEQLKELSGLNEDQRAWALKESYADWKAGKSAPGAPGATSGGSTPTATIPGETTTDQSEAAAVINNKGANYEDRKQYFDNNFKTKDGATDVNAVTNAKIPLATAKELGGADSLSAGIGKALSSPEDVKAVDKGNLQQMAQLDPKATGEALRSAYADCGGA